MALGFSIVTWQPGPGTTNPIGTTTGLWAFTWVLQVMPLFFFVGGFAHLVTWESVQRAGGGYREFLARRLKRLLLPTSICLAIVAVIWSVLRFGPVTVPHLNATVMLILSPLWFLAIFVALVLLAPAFIRLHRSTGVWGPVALARPAILVDVCVPRPRSPHRMAQHGAGVGGLAMALRLSTTSSFTRVARGGRAITGGYTFSAPLEAYRAAAQ